MKRILITGSQGFIGSYLCQELLAHGYEVMGLDNFSKYGKLHRPQDNHPHFLFLNFDVAKGNLWSVLENFQPEQFIMGAAMIGGISYFHELPYDLLATNERITANSFDAAIKAFQAGFLKRVIVLSSSMVYEAATKFPVKEEDVKVIPSPFSSYGFQKLATEYYAKAAYDQYGLPYTIIRPFNCVGVGEDKAITNKEIMSGNIKLTMSHVLPDLVHKLLQGQKPLRLLGDGNQVRCFTHGKDIARGIRMAMESNESLGEAFNISSPTPTKIIDLAKMLWEIINPEEPFAYESDNPYEHDVQFRLPDIIKAEKLLGFKSEISLKQSISEVIEYLRSNKFKTFT